jgi:hypothetical protein
MAISTVDGVIAGFKPPQFVWKDAGAAVVAGRAYTPFYAPGIPSAAAAPTPGISGAALTSYAGQIPFTNPSSGQNTYLARLAMVPLSQGGAITLADRLWHNSGITITSTTAQTVNSVTFPARDANGTTNGEGVYLGVEVSSATGAGTPTITVSYTNSDNTSGRTATNVFVTSANSAVGTFYPLGLQAGDKGVRSIQSITLSATWTSGTIHLVAYRPLVSVQSIGGGVCSPVDALTSGLVRLYDNTVPFLLFIPNAITATGFTGTLTVTQG